jgi:hypothetical protein
LCGRRAVTADEVDRHVDAGVRTFLATHGGR